MKVDAPTDLDGRIFMAENRARVVGEATAAFAATVTDMPITQRALDGLSQIAEELADALRPWNAEALLSDTGWKENDYRRLKLIK
jgi:hypothetical protein